MHSLIPDFTRISWTSDAARDAWAPRIKRIGQAWRDIEWLSVVDGLRRCAIAVVSAEELLTSPKTWLAHGLTFLPLELQGASASGYSAVAKKAAIGDPVMFRIALGRLDDLCTLSRAWTHGDDAVLGEYLGFPRCCVDFFESTWVQRGSIDPTGWMTDAEAVTIPGSDAQLEPLHTNILLRWAGVRAVPHLPCSHSCRPTAELGRKMMRVGRAAGFLDETAWIEQMLSWPVEWSALHGIAELRTPVFKVVTRTDRAPAVRTVRRRGRSYPCEGARGNRFPYTDAHAGVRTPDQSIAPAADELARDNGFGSAAAMAAAHSTILESTEGLRALLTNPTWLDLGCGNGALLARLRQASPGTSSVFGAEIDAARSSNAGWFGIEVERIEVGNIFALRDTWSRKYDCVVLMVGRLSEVDSEQARQLCRNIQTCARWIIMYAYDDRDVGRLATQVAKELALPLRVMLTSKQVVVAEIVEHD